MKHFLIIIIFMIGYGSIGQTIHEVRKDENLWNISKKYYNTGYEYVRIWQDSKTDGITNDPNLIYPGMILLIKSESTKINPTFNFQDSILDKMDTIITRFDTTISKIDNIEGIKTTIEKNNSMKSSLLSNLIFPLIVALISAIMVERYVSKRIKPFERKKFIRNFKNMFGI